MSAGDDTKTREELLAEIDALKAKLERQGSEAGKPLSEKLSAPVFSVPLTRRGALASWVAPVILSLPVLGTVLRPGTAYAADGNDDTTPPNPTAQPVASPTSQPVANPTAVPSATPTSVGRCIANPTAKPTAKPTVKPSVAPTAAAKPKPTFTPTVAPTLGVGAAPDSRPSSAGFVALGSARAVSGLFDT